MDIGADVQKKAERAQLLDKIADLTLQNVIDLLEGNIVKARTTNEDGSVTEHVLTASAADRAAIFKLLKDHGISFDASELPESLVSQMRRDKLPDPNEGGEEDAA